MHKRMPDYKVIIVNKYTPDHHKIKYITHMHAGTWETYVPLRNKHPSLPVKPHAIRGTSGERFRLGKRVHNTGPWMASGWDPGMPLMTRGHCWQDDRWHTRINEERKTGFAPDAHGRQWRYAEQHGDAWTYKLITDIRGDGLIRNIKNNRTCRLSIGPARDEIRYMSLLTIQDEWVILSIYMYRFARAKALFW